MRKKIAMLLIAALLLSLGCSKEQAPEPIKQTPVPTCSDNIQNQGETAIDCGGPCQACPSCTDGLMNQGETGIDCGGPCRACETCSDGLMNQGETGIDCGGPCPACPPVQTAPTQLDISDSDKEILREKLTQFVNTAMAKNSVLAKKVGDTHVFAFGMRNNAKFPSSFRINVTFVNARDLKSNPIATRDMYFDDSYILQWFGKNDFSRTYELDVGAQAAVPLIIEVKDMYAAGKKTVPGTYYFKVQVRYKNEYGQWRDYGSANDFSIQIV